MPFRLVKEALLATLFFLIIVLFVSLIPFKFEFIKPIKQDFEDFDIYDLFYTGKAKERSGQKDTNIVVIQAASTRAEILDQINKLKQQRPVVIGIDLSFVDRKEPKSDSALRLAILSDSNIVTGYSLGISNDEKPIIKEHLFSEEYYLKNGGFINFSQKDSNSVIRSIAPFQENGESKYLSFASKIVQKYNRVKFEKLKSRNKATEFINYYGNQESYFCYSASDFNSLYYSGQARVVSGKIVLLGFFSPHNGTAPIMEDLKFSPLNEKPNGKSFPDIYGVLIHANFLSMAIDGNNYIKSAPTFVSYLSAFFICFFIILYILFCYKKYGHPSHIRFFILLLFSTLLIVYFFLKLYDWFNWRINLIPIILSVVIAIEMFEMYKKLAIYLSKALHYNTIFSEKKVLEHENH
jgi:CHASE2 domain-containing sensor protein